MTCACTASPPVAGPDTRRAYHCRRIGDGRGTIGVTDEVGQQVRRAARSRTLDRLARFGLICRSALYVLIGSLALQVSFGSGSQEADKSGAIRTVAEQPFGSLVLWLLLVGFIALALWQLTEVVLWSNGIMHGIESGARAVFYAVLVASLANLLLIGGQAGSDDEHAQDLTAKVLQLPAGQWLVGAGGLGLLGLGFYWAYSAVSRRFLRNIKVGQLSSRTRPVVTTLGVIGYAVRSLIAGFAAVFLVRATIEYEPDEVKGLDATLRSFADTPVGPWLLTLMALGLLCFAAYCLCEARWRRV